MARLTRHIPITANPKLSAFSLPCSRKVIGLKNKDSFDRRR
jgi:hypothetical protein